MEKTYVEDSDAPASRPLMKNTDPFSGLAEPFVVIVWRVRFSGRDEAERLIPAEVASPVPSFVSVTPIETVLPGEPVALVALRLATGDCDVSVTVPERDAAVKSVFDGDPLAST
jgi:hypothetical protein